MQLGFEGVTFSTDCQLEHPLNPRTITVNVRIRFIIPTIKLTHLISQILCHKKVHGPLVRGLLYNL